MYLDLDLGIAPTIDRRSSVSSSNSVQHSYPGLINYSGTRGIYASVSVDGLDVELSTLQASLGMLGLSGQQQQSQLTKASELHITIAHSTWANVNTFKLKSELWDHLHLDGSSFRYPYIITGVSYWKGDSRRGYLILDVHSQELQLLHNRFIRVGAVHSYAQYHPHITIAKDVGSLNLKLISHIDDLNSIVAKNSTYTSRRFAHNLVCCDLRTWST